ncbi:glycosyl transferase, partial [Tsukamurella pulmonis]
GVELPDGARDGGGGPGGQAANAELVALLKGTTTQWAAAVNGAQSQGSLQLNSGRPVIAIGGFSGSDPAPTLAQFQQWVKDGRISYYVASGGFRPGAGTSEIQSWVEKNFTATKVGSATVYELVT